MGCIARHMFVDESNIEILDQLDKIQVLANKLEDEMGYAINKDVKPDIRFSELSNQLRELMLKYTSIVGEYFLDTFYMYPDPNSFYPRIMINNLRYVYVKEHYDDTCYFLGVLIRCGYISHTYIGGNHSKKDDVIVELFKKGLAIPEYSKKCQHELFVRERIENLEKVKRYYSTRSLKNKKEIAEYERVKDEIYTELHGLLISGHMELWDVISGGGELLVHVGRPLSEAILENDGIYIPSRIRKQIDYYLSDEANERYNKEVKTNVDTEKWRFLRNYKLDEIRIYSIMFVGAFLFFAAMFGLITKGNWIPLLGGIVVGILLYLSKFVFNLIFYIKYKRRLLPVKKKWKKN